MYKLEILLDSGEIKTEVFNKQIQIVQAYGIGDRGLRKSIEKGDFIKGHNYTYKCSEISIDIEEDIKSPSFVTTYNYTIEKDKDVYKAVILADYHFPYQDKGCSEAFMKFINDNKYDISEIVDAGDGADCGALSTHLHLEEEKMELYKELDGYANLQKI